MLFFVAEREGFTLGIPKGDAFAQTKEPRGAEAHPDAKKEALWLPSDAEREGFKPPERTSRSPDFESGPIGHSGISPLRLPFTKAVAKVSK